VKSICTKAGVVSFCAMAGVASFCEAAGLLLLLQALKTAVVVVQQKAAASANVNFFILFELEIFALQKKPETPEGIFHHLKSVCQILKKAQIWRP
jgi:hypothetical protein